MNLIDINILVCWEMYMTHKCTIVFLPELYVHITLIYVAVSTDLCVNVSLQTVCSCGTAGCQGLSE